MRGRQCIYFASIAYIPESLNLAKPMSRKPNVKTVALFLTVLSFAEASADADTRWTLRARTWAESTVEEPYLSGERDVGRKEYFVAYRWLTSTSDTEASYAHNPILIRAGNPAHNGYFHQLDIQHQHVSENLNFGIKLGVHASSNMFKHGEFHDEALVGRFNFSYPVIKTFAVGASGDHRFGHFQLYPTLSWSGEFAGGIARVRLPTMLQWQSASKRWHVALERYGEKWATLDEARELESAIYLNEWRLQGSWQIPSVWKGINLELGIGCSTHTKLHYRDLVLGSVETKLDPAGFVWVGLTF